MGYAPQPLHDLFDCTQALQAKRKKQHSMPSRVETCCPRYAVSKHVIALTVIVSIKLDQVVRCEGVPQCMLRPVLKTRCADHTRLEKLNYDFWRHPTADSGVLPSNTT